MKNTLITAMAAASVLMVGCGDDSGTQLNTVELESKTAIVTQDDARKAAALVNAMQFNTIAGSMTQVLTAPQRNSVRITYPAPYEKVRVCAAGGSVTTVGEKSNLFTYHATNTFLNCQYVNEFMVNGSQTVDATLENNRLAASLSDNMIIVSLGDFVMSIVSDMKLYANRDLSIVETILLKDSIMYQYNVEEGYEGGGSMNVFGATYRDFNVTLNALQQTMHLNGQVQIDECGSYEIKTVSPIFIGTDGSYASGELNINGAQYVYHNNNTVTVTIDDATVYTVSQDIIGNLCGLENESKDEENTRFMRDNRVEIVLDNEEGLMWQDNEAVKTVYKPWVSSDNYSAGHYNDTTGDTAATYCSGLTLGGYDNWRLPNSEELLSIADADRRPAINTVFENISNANWSSQSARNQEFAQYANFGLFGNISSTRKNFILNVRCVRDELH